MKSLRSVVLLGVQLVCILYLVLSGHLFAAHPWVWLELAGLILLAWAIYTVQPHRVNPLPDLRSDARLVTGGPYRYVRHPMYTGVLLATLALVLDKFTLSRIVVWLVLLVDLLAKLEYEESLLGKRFTQYGGYQQRTKKLIPFVY